MNIFNKVTMEGMKKSSTRTIVTIIGVILSAALITGVATFGVSLLDYMTRGAIQKEGDWHVEFVDVPSSFVEKQAHNEEVSNTIAIKNIGYSTLNGSKNPAKPYYFIAGFNDKALKTLPIKMISGRLPKNSSEALLSLAVSANGGVKVAEGDILSLDVSDRMSGNKKLSQHIPYAQGKENLVSKENKTYKVVGVCQRPSIEEFSAPGYTLITKSDANDKADSYSLFVKLKNPHNINSYVNKVAGTKDYVCNDNVLRFMGLSQDKVFNVLIYSIGGIVLSIIMIGSIFLIYNSFNISLNERMHQFGILSSIGATSKQLRNSVLFEGFCIGVIAIPIGIIVGIVSIGAVISVVAVKFKSIFYSNVSLSLIVSLPAIIVAAIVSMITILISAYIPARKAAKAPVIDSLRQTKEVKVEVKDMKTSKIVQKIFGLEGILALKNFKRNKKRYRSIVLSLALSIILFISTNSFVNDLKQTSSDSVAYTNYDMGLSTEKMDDNKMISIYNKLKNTDGVYESSYQALIKYSCSFNSEDLSDDYFKQAGSQSKDKPVNLSMQVQFLKDSEYKSIIKSLGLSEKEYYGENAKIIAVAKVQDNTEKDIHDMKNLFKNSSMDFNITSKTDDKESTESSKTVKVKFVETVPPDSLPVTTQYCNEKDKNTFITVMAPYSLKEKLEPDDKDLVVKGLTFKSKNPSNSVDKMKDIIQTLDVTSDEYTLYNFYEMLSENRNIVFIVNIFAYTFIALISLIAVANVFNTISTNIKLRKRELAMLRSLGMSDHDFQKTMNFECVFYGMKSLIIGLPLSAVSSYLIYRWMCGGETDGYKFIFPWGSVVISMIAVFLVVFITMLYSISKIKKENIIDALRDDMN